MPTIRPPIVNFETAITECLCGQAIVRRDFGRHSRYCPFIADDRRRALEVEQELDGEDQGE